MPNQKYYIAINEYERRIIINSLNNLRNHLLSEGRYTDCVDELLVKVVYAKRKKVKIR